MRRSHPEGPSCFESNRSAVGGGPPTLRMMLENGRANGRRWRVSAGFLLQAALLSLVLLLPLFHTEPLDAQAPQVGGPIYVVVAPRGEPDATGTGPGGGGSASPTKPQWADLSETPILPIPGVRPEVGPAPNVGRGNGSEEARPGIPGGADNGPWWGTELGDGPPAPIDLEISRMQLPRLLVRVEPNYPMAARRAGLEGDVRLEATLAADGRVEQVRVLSGQPLLAEAARAAVERWRYEPTYLNGRPVAVLLRVTVQFHLQR